jgi:hypothetical protein
MTPTDEARFIELWNQGASYADIAQCLGILRGTAGSRALTAEPWQAEATPGRTW